MRKRIIVLSAILTWTTPLGAKPADLVVWWQKGAYAQEDAALREIIAAFEQGSGKKVELSLYEEEELPDALMATLGPASRPT
jgi:ABC-type glycerol-3-phosphate transport system substrate-binding protein